MYFPHREIKTGWNTKLVNCMKSILQFECEDIENHLLGQFFPSAVNLVVCRSQQQPYFDFEHNGGRGIEQNPHVFRQLCNILPSVSHLLKYLPRVHRDISLYSSTQATVYEKKISDEINRLITCDDRNNISEKRFGDFYHNLFVLIIDPKYSKESEERVNTYKSYAMSCRLV